MSPLTRAISATVSLLIMAWLALTMRGQARNAHEGTQWPLRDGTRVLTTITDVQSKQDWKEEERWERNPWDGRLVRQRTWHTSYEVTARWVHGQTKQSYTLRSTVWSEEVARIPTTGQTVVFIVDRRHPQRSAVDWQSLS
jgi:hypothetical protein